MNFKMKKLTYKELPEVLSDSIVLSLRKMELEQTSDWIEIFEKMTPDQWSQYESIKLRQIRGERKTSSEFNQEKWDNEFRDFWIRYVNRERSISDLSIEDEISFVADFSVSEDALRKITDSKTVERITYRRNFISESEKFVFFWATESPFSQWSKAYFRGKTFIQDDKESDKVINGFFPYDFQTYSSSEQFMMYHKAIVFLDRDTAQKIMSTNDVRKIKELGRQVKNFDENVWRYFRGKVVYEGNKSKFTQNDALKLKLFATKGTTLVEASPHDSIWGIGLTESDPRAMNRRTWMGHNLLGEILTKIRIELMGEY